MALNTVFYRDRIKIGLIIYFCLLVLFVVFKVALVSKVVPTSTVDAAFALEVLEASISKTAKREPSNPPKEPPPEPAKELTDEEIEAKLGENILLSQKEEQTRLEAAIKLEAEAKAEAERIKELERIKKLEHERLEKEKAEKIKQAELERQKKEAERKKAEAEKAAMEKKLAEQKSAEQKKRQEEDLKKREKERREHEALKKRQEEEAAEKRKIQEQTVAVEADYRDPKLNNAKPKQPLSSIKAGEYGEVLLSVRVGADGSIIDITIVKSSGYARLDNAVMYAVKTWRFHPAKNIFGQSIPSTVPFSFKFDPAQGED